MLCWPSVQYLSDATCQDRKTVVDGLKRLRDAGYIKNTEARKGATGQIPVYLLKTPEIGTVKKVEGGGVEPVLEPANSTENGNVTESGTVPFFPTNSPEFPHQQSQISLVTDPKTGHGTNKEPVRNQERTRKRAAGFDPSSVDLPSWLEREHWLRWVADRKARGKGITADAAALQIKNLGNYRDEGFTALEVIEHSIANSYTGLFPPSRRAAKKAPTSSRHSGFRQIDYEEGLTDGIPDA